MVQIEVRGQVIRLPRALVERRQQLAAAQAGSSSRLRDLALVLDWVLNTNRILALRRSELRELERLASSYPELADLGPALPVGRERRAA